MSGKRRTKSRKKVIKTAEKPEIVVREVELGGAGKTAGGDRGGDREGILEEDEVPETGEGEAFEEGGALEADRGEAFEEGATPEVGKGEDEDGEKKRSGWLHRVNIYYPWLKFVVLTAVVIGVTFGAFGMGKLVGNVILEATGGTSAEETTPDEPEKTEPSEGAQEKPAEEGETPTEEEKPSEGATKPEQPEVTTKPPVEPPETNGKKLVALTFDDGPSTVTTGRLLDILKAKGVKATFFVVGSMAIRAPDLMKREAAEGHEVGGHSAFHQDLSKFSATDLQADVANMDQIFRDVLGRKMEIMRPPYGAVSDTMRGYIGKPMVNWSVDPLDWKYRNAATVRANVVGATTDGAIVLLHDIHASTVDAVAGIIDDLRARGFEFLTVSELAAARGVGLTSGVVYYNFKP